MVSSNYLIKDNKNLNNIFPDKQCPGCQVTEKTMIHLICGHYICCNNCSKNPILTHKCYECMEISEKGIDPIQLC